MLERSFPQELLNKSIKEKVAYFKGYTVSHPKLNAVYKELLRAIREPASATLIFVYGPTGIGKTTLRLKIQQKLIEDALPDLEIDRGRIPVVGMELEPPSSTIFKWKDYYKTALKQLEPEIDKRNHYDIYGVRGIQRDIEGKLSISEKVDSADLRDALKNALRYRRPDIFFIDEAQHFAKIASGSKLVDQMDLLKSLANTTQILHGLTGTYELLAFDDLSAQLGRRSLDIHFSRYLPDNKRDNRDFMSIVKSLQQQLPLEELPNLLGYSEYIYEGTLGCVGVLKDWLTRGLDAALEDNANTLTIEHLEKTILPLKTREEMLKEIIAGERRLMETQAKRNEFRAALGFSPIESSTTTDRVDTTPLPATKGTGRKTKVGQRKPKRDPIGIEHDAS